jgi:hypothetical protein
MEYKSGNQKVLFCKAVLDSIAIKHFELHFYIP